MKLPPFPTWGDLVRDYPHRAIELAHHESAHAVAHWMFREGFEIIDMRGNENDAAFVRSRSSGPGWIRQLMKASPPVARTQAAWRVMGALAGPYAESKIANPTGSDWLDELLDEWRYLHDESPDADLGRAIQYAEAISQNRGPRPWTFIRRIAGWTEQAFDTPELWAVVEALADRLMHVDCLSHEDASAVMDQAWAFDHGDLPLLQLGGEWRRRFVPKVQG